MNRLVLAADLRVQQRGPGGDADLTGPGADLQAQRVPERDCYSYYLRSADSVTIGTKQGFGTKQASTIKLHFSDQGDHAHKIARGVLRNAFPAQCGPRFRGPRFAPDVEAL